MRNYNYSDDVLVQSDNSTTGSGKQERQSYGGYGSPCPKTELPLRGRKSSITLTLLFFFVTFLTFDSFSQTYTTAIGEIDTGNKSAGAGDYNIHVGAYAGWLANSGTNYNAFVGYSSGYNNSAGDHNAYLGYFAGFFSNGSYNTYVGSQSGRYNITGISNSFFGYRSGYNATAGISNVFIGSNAGYKNNGNSNTFLGESAGFNNSSGHNNTILGSGAGSNASGGSGNVFIGRNSGYNETGSNMLYIDNSSTSTPLIWGDFSANLLRFNGEVEIGSIPLKRNANRAGLLEIGRSNSESWSGISIEHTSTSAWSLMGNQSDFGLYDDYNNKWALRHNENSSVELFHNGSVRFNTSSEGAVVSGRLSSNTLRFVNEEQADASEDGEVYFDQNYHGDYSSFTGGNGGGLAVKTEDGWGAIIATNNMQWITPNFNGLGIGTSTPDAALSVIGAVRGSYDPQETEYVEIRHGGSHGYVNTVGDGRLDFRHDGDTKMSIMDNGYVGIGTGSPSEMLEIAGSIRGNISGGALRVKTLYGYTDLGAQDANWSHFSTDRSRFLFNSGITVDQGLIGSYDEDLQLQTSGVTAITVANSNQDVTVANNLIVGGTLQLNRENGNIPPDDNVEDLMVLKSDGTLAIRDVRSIESPWLLDDLGAGLINIGCDPDVLGDCEINVFDLNGNLRIGDNSVLDDDMDYGGLGDDWMKFSGYVEFSTSSDAGDKGLILLDRTNSLSYLNLFQNGNTSYFSNSQNANEDGFFLKSEGRNVDFGGDVGIGLAEPATNKLDINGTARLRGLAANPLESDIVTTDANGVLYKRNLDTFTPWRKSVNNTYYSNSRIGIGAENTSSDISALIETDLNTGLLVKSTNSGSGSHGIKSQVSSNEVKAFTATNSVTGSEVFRVYGNGIIETKEVLVSVNIWNDHVFYPTYNLMPIEKVEEYVKENHHLPEIPSEIEVLENGVNLGEMDGLLLKKVEELTLYIIEQNKQLKEQADLLKQQADRIEKLEEKLD